MNKYLNIALNIISPAKCVFCGKTLPLDAKEDFWVCGKCVNELPFCAGSAEPAPPLDRTASVFVYEDEVKDAIHRFKFKGKRHYSNTFARFMSILAQARFGNVDALIPIPLTSKKFRERGYNQTYELAVCISKRLKIPIWNKCLLKIKDTPSQTTLTAEERQKNVEGTFALSPKADVRGRVLLLVDDVFTTGATVRECAKMLKEAGASAVCAVTVASTQI